MGRFLDLSLKRSLLFIFCSLDSSLYLDRVCLTSLCTSIELVGQFLVDTPTCQIPNVDPLDPTVRQFAFPPRRPNCSRGWPPLTYSDLDSVYLLSERQHLYGARSVC